MQAGPSAYHDLEKEYEHEWETRDMVVFWRSSTAFQYEEQSEEKSAGKRPATQGSDSHATTQVISLSE